MKNQNAETFKVTLLIILAALPIIEYSSPAMDQLVPALTGFKYFQTKPQNLLMYI